MEAYSFDNAVSSEHKFSQLTTISGATPMKQSVLELNNSNSMSAILGSPIRKPENSFQTPLGAVSASRDSSSTLASTLRSFIHRSISPRESSQRYNATQHNELKNDLLRDRLQDKLKSLENEFEKNRKSDSLIITKSDKNKCEIPITQSLSVPIHSSFGESREALLMENEDEEESANEIPQLV